jgi:hypothetical protein
VGTHNHTRENSFFCGWGPGVDHRPVPGCRISDAPRGSLPERGFRRQACSCTESAITLPGGRPQAGQTLRSGEGGVEFLTPSLCTKDPTPCKKVRLPPAPLSIPFRQSLTNLPNKPGDTAILVASRSGQSALASELLQSQSIATRNGAIATAGCGGSHGWTRS